MRRLPSFIQPLASLKLTVALLFGIMVVVFLCTLEQVQLGTHWAVEKDIRSPLIYWTSASGALRIPIFPGGGFLGALLLVNLLATLWSRFYWVRQKTGLWMIHVGLIVLVAGEFVTGFCQVETQMPLEEGESSNYSESSLESELAIIDTSNPDYDEVVSIPEVLLKRGGVIHNERLPFDVCIKDFYLNAELTMVPSNGPPSRASQGIGRRVQARPLRRSTTDDPNVTTVYAELKTGDHSLGTWLLSTGLGGEEKFAVEGGRTFRMQMRPRREYLSCTLTLIDFRHDIYAGTDIPKNFSSTVHLSDSGAGENREVRIYMNHPLRYGGRTFYQSGFGRNDKMSILQVVSNPGWRLPYVSFALIGIGLLVHFVMSFSKFQKGRPAHS